MKLNGIHQILVYADEVNILGGSVYTVKKKTEALVASKETGIKVSAERSKYMVMSCNKISVRSHSIMTDNSSFEKVEQFKYLEKTLTDQNYTQENIKSRLKSGIVCYHSVQNISSSSVLPKNTKVKAYRNINFSDAFYGCETWLLTLREKHRLRVFENRVLRRIFGPKRKEVQGNGENYIMRILMICIAHQILFG